MKKVNLAKFKVINKINYRKDFIPIYYKIKYINLYNLI